MSNWIDVKDRLPEIPPADCVYVLCQIGEIEPPVVLCYITGERGDGKFYMDFRQKNYFESWSSFVTHWQPLPESPQTTEP